MTIMTKFYSLPLISFRQFHSAQLVKTLPTTSLPFHFMLVSIVHARILTNLSKWRSIQSNLDGQHSKTALSPSEVVFMFLSTSHSVRISCESIITHLLPDTLVAIRLQNSSCVTTGGQQFNGTYVISSMDVKPANESSRIVLLRPPLFTHSNHPLAPGKSSP